MSLCTYSTSTPAATRRLVICSLARATALLLASVLPMVPCTDGGEAAAFALAMIDWLIKVVWRLAHDPVTRAGRDPGINLRSACDPGVSRTQTWTSMSDVMNFIPRAIRFVKFKFKVYNCLNLLNQRYFICRFLKRQRKFSPYFFTVLAEDGS